MSLAALCCWFVLGPCSPQFPQPGLDPSWVAVVGEASAARARWGLDIVFTYGPASSIVTGYYTGDYVARTMPLLIGLALIHGICATALLLPESVAVGRGLLRSVVAVACYAVMIVVAGRGGDGFFFSTIFLVFVLDLQRRPGDRLRGLATMLGAAAIGVLCLSKLSFGTLALPLLGLADARACLKRRLPFRLLLTGAAFVVVYLWYGQSLSDLPAFLSTQKEIIAGYADAMSIPGLPLETLGFVLLAGGFWAAICVSEARATPDRLDRLTLPIGLAWFLFIGFKAGFVRHDLHSLTSWICLGFAGVMVGFARVQPRSKSAGAALVLLSLAAATVIDPYVVVLANDEPDRGAAMLQTYRDWFAGAREELVNERRALRHPATFEAGRNQDKTNVWADMRAKAPLPKLEGTVDIIQSDQTRVMANGLAYRARPVFQEYSTYTAKLMEANQAFYEGERAPDWVIFAPGSIDGRYPAFAEGSLWPVLMRRYEPTLRIDDQLALHKRSLPIDVAAAPPETRVGTLNDSMPVEGSGLVYARITVKPTILGRLLTSLYRAPLLGMVVRLKSGQEQSFRFVPAFGSGGFMLSPLISSAEDYLLATDGDSNATPNDVVGVTIVGGRLAEWAYAKAVSFEFTPMSVPVTAPSPAAEPLFRAAVAWRALVKRLGLQDRVVGDRLTLQPPATVDIPLDGKHRVAFDFGIEEGAWNPGKTHGVCFDLKAQAQATVLWHRCLDPAKVPADRGDQTAAVNVPADIPAVTIETSCVEDCTWNWSYVSNIAPQP